MIRHSFFFRLLLGNLLLVGAIAVIGGGIAFTVLNNHFVQIDQAHQDTLTRMAAAHFERLWPAGAEQIDRDCHNLLNDPSAVGGRSDTRLTVIAADGRVLGDNWADAARMENHKTPSRPEVLAALEGRAGWDTRRSATLDQPQRYHAVPIMRDGQVVAAARTSMAVRTIAQNRSFLLSALAWAALAGVVAAVSLGLLLSWLWYAPLRQITRAARQIAAGDLSSRAQISGPAELSLLGAALNEMRQSLADQIDLIGSQREDLRTVVIEPARRRGGHRRGRADRADQPGRRRLLADRAERPGRTPPPGRRPRGWTSSTRTTAPARPASRSTAPSRPNSSAGRRHLDVAAYRVPHRPGGRHPRPAGRPRRDRPGPRPRP